MVPKIHAKGSGFGGITQYVLHDKDANTSERVAWTETVNLGTRNPETASRVMMATSMDQDRLKKEAGVKATGRKSKDHVLHVTLSWHADESVDLTRDEQIRAAKWFMREINADDRQALIVSHSDEPQAHVHLVINRVSPKDGRILPSSFERLNASKWAEKYERDRGEILCHQRAINNAARERGEYTRGKKDLPRAIHEQMAAVSNDNTKKNALLAEQRKRVAAIAKEQRELKARHKAEWLQMEARTKKQRQETTRQSKLDVIKARQGVRDKFRLQWEEHHHDKQADQAQFNLNEKTLRGRIENAKKLVAWRDLVGKKAEGQRVSTIAAAFRVFASEGARRDALAKQQRHKEAALKRSQHQAENKAVVAARSKLPDRKMHDRNQFETQRSAIVAKHRMEAAKVKAAWRNHERKQKQEWDGFRSDPKEEAIRKRAAAWVASRGKKTKTSDIVPADGSTKAAMQIDSYLKSVEDQRKRAANDQEKGRDGDGQER